MYYSKAPVLALSLLLVACDNSNPVAETTVDDTTAPTVISTTPADAATGVATSSTVQATFSEDMLTTSIDNTSVTLSGASNVTGTVDFDGLANIVTFTPDSSLRMLTNYTATLSASITDLVGNPLNGGTDSSWRFTTADGVWGTAELIETDNAGYASSPQIAIDSNGNALAVWAQSDGTRNNIWANRYDATTGWGTAALIESNDAGTANESQIAFDSTGNALAVWYQHDGTRNNIWANRYDAATGWGTAELIESDDTSSAYSPQIAIDSNGNALAVWVQSDGTRNNIWANRYDATTGWGTAALIESNDAGTANDSQIAFDSTGNALAVWYQHDGTRNNIWANRYNAATGWGTAELIESDDTSSANAPQIAIDSTGNALAVWSQGGHRLTNIWANRYDATTGWGTAVLIESDAGEAIAPQIAIDSTGNALAVWYQSDGTRNNIWANRYDATTGWGTAALIEDDTGSATSPQIAIDSSGNALAVWYQSGGTGNNMWANRYDATTGWGTAALIEDDTGSATTPQIAIGSTGNALAVWGLYDGARINIWANRFE